MCRPRVGRRNKVPKMTDTGRLRTLLDRSEFVITAEMTPLLTTDPDEFRAAAQPLKGRADAVNVTDAAGARVSMSSMAAATLLLRDGIEPVMQITCRDRNRIAIANDLIGAAALGIRNLLVLTGDDPKGGDEPDAMPVFDLASSEIIAIARRMSDRGEIPSGRTLSGGPSWLVGAADLPFDPPSDWKPDSLIEKIDAGAEFIQTQFCFEPKVARRYFTRLGDFGILDKLSFIVGVGPIASARSAKWMHDNLHGVSVPDAIIKRLQGADDQAAEGRKICCELIQEYHQMPGVSGVHVMAPAQDAHSIADVIDASMVLTPAKAN